MPANPSLTIVLLLSTLLILCLTFLLSFYSQFREDITSLNRKHREEIKQLERAATEAQVSGKGKFSSSLLFFACILLFIFFPCPAKDGFLLRGALLPESMIWQDSVCKPMLLAIAVKSILILTEG